MNKTKKIKYKFTNPKKDGYYMPSEFDVQSSTWLGWPSNKGTLG